MDRRNAIFSITRAIVVVKFVMTIFNLARSRKTPSVDRNSDFRSMLFLNSDKIYGFYLWNSFVSRGLYVGQMSLGITFFLVKITIPCITINYFELSRTQSKIAVL